MPSTLKRLTLSTGLYRPARALHRRLSSAQARAFADDVALYRELVPEGALCFDVGANIGERTEALLSVGARVVAFEPQPECVEEIHARCAPFKERLDVVQAAVSDAPGLMPLHLARHHGSSSLRAGWGEESGEVLHTPTITLDIAASRFGLPHYVKIDVEGWEPQVLAGLSHSVALVSFEYHRLHLGLARDCLARLSGEVNFTGPEDNRFRMREWVEVEHFDVQRLASEPYGDVFVRHR